MHHIPFIAKIILFFFGLSFVCAAQNEPILSGKITSEEDGEPLVDVRISVPNLSIATRSDQNGFYTLSLPKGTHTIEAFMVGMQVYRRVIHLQVDTIIDFQLQVISKELSELEIIAKRAENVESAHLGVLSLQIEEIRKLPAFLGEVDPIRAIQLLPGVSSVSEAGQGFYVRGGGPDQNLVLLDDAVIYNSSHLFGFFSVFNPEAVQNVRLIKGGMPAQYGGRLSSVLEVNTVEGNKKSWRASGGIGLISSRIALDGPIHKGRGSLMIAARRTYVDLLMKVAIPPSSDFYGSSYFFYDLNMKGNYRLSDKDQLFLSAYLGKDQFKFEDHEDEFVVRMPWQNAVSALKWQHLFNQKLLLNTTVNYSSYQFSFGSEQEEIALKLSSSIHDVGAKIELTYFPNPRHTIKMGGQYIHHQFIPTSVSASQDAIVFNTGLGQSLFSHETGVFVSDDWDISEYLRFSLGLRHSSFTHVGPFTRFTNGSTALFDSLIIYKKKDKIAHYNGWEPRLSMRYLLSNTSSLKLAWVKNYQYIHLASISSVSLPTDIWYPTTDLALPERGWQAAFGYFQNFLNDLLESSIEIYYKKMSNLVEFKEGSLPTDNINDNTDNLLTLGEGWSYGAEFFIKKTKGKFSGWIGYTWSKTDRKFPELNEGKIFPTKYDRRHDLSVVANYTLFPRLIIGATFIYATGNTLTLPNAWYVHQNNLLFHYGERNSTRMPPYHRMDWSITWHNRTTKRIKSHWILSVYNVYNRANPYFIYLSRRGSIANNNVQLKTKQVSLFPILPSITWNAEL